MLSLSFYSVWCSSYCHWFPWCVNTLRPRQNGRHFADDNFKCIFLNENIWISIKISLKFVSSSLIDNKPALVQIMAWRRPGDEPLSEPMLVSSLTHICVTRPQWVKAVCRSLEWVRLYIVHRFMFICWHIPCIIPIGFQVLLCHRTPLGYSELIGYSNYSATSFTNMN